MNLFHMEPRILIPALLGILFVIYGLFIMVNTAGTNFYLTWFGLGFIAFAIAHGRYFGWLNHIPLPLRNVVAVLSVAVVSATLIWCVYIYQQSKQEAPDGLDTLIVLGAQVKADGTPAPSLEWRLETAAVYLKLNPKTNVIVCGGQGPSEPTTEASAMARTLEDFGIDAARISQENQSASTAQNLSYALDYTSPDATVGIVTNDFHIYRALRIAKNAGYTHAYGLSAPSNPLFLPNNLLREFIALGAAGYIFQQLNPFN